MKSKSMFVVVLSFVVLVAGCGNDGKKGGVNESGVEANGKCSAALISDLKTFVNDINDAAAANDRAKGKAVCNKFTGKYGNVSCVSPETGKRFEGGQLVESCNKL